MMALIRPLLPHIAAVTAILGVLWWLDHRGYERARADMAGQAARLESRLRVELRESERRLGDRMVAIDRDVSARIAGIDQMHRTVIQPTLVKELNRETRYFDPDRGISDSLRAEVNRALAAVACAPAADGGIVCALPDAGPARVE